MSREHLGWLATEPENVPDGYFIREMLVPITDAEARAKHRGWGFANWEPDKGEAYFTCRHWDPTTRLCTVYDDRPQMCRDHPRGACKFRCGIAG